MSKRYGVFVNGEKREEFTCPRVAEDRMDQLVDELTPDDPTASFDVMQIEE